MKNKIEKIIEEVINQNFKEDVGDEYLKRKYSIPGEFDDFEAKFKASQAGEQKLNIVHRDGDWVLYKNPNTLTYSTAKARGVITEDGDLYLESVSGKKIHHDILKILYDKGILKNAPDKSWGRKSPTDSGFLTVQRYQNSKYIAIGESNRFIYNESDYDNNINDYNIFLNKAKIKNPNIGFENKLVGTKSVKIDPSSDNMMNETYLI